MNICLIGVDGVGKTSHCKHIKKFLKQKTKKEIFYFHSGRFRRSLKIPLLMIQNKIQGRSLICDKSYYDYIAVLYPSSFLKYQTLTKLLIYSMLPFLPKFDLTLFLMASFEEVSKRKNEVSLREYKKRMKIYDILSKKINVIKINTERNFGDVKKNIQSNITRKLKYENNHV